MNWHIGQEIVCIKTHSKGAVKRGKTYTIHGLKKSPCSCNMTIIDVGVISDNPKTRHSPCGFVWNERSGVHWFGESLFAPLEYNQDAINELLEEPITISQP
jgi:hypothetical protein